MIRKAFTSLFLVCLAFFTQGQNSKVNDLLQHLENHKTDWQFSSEDLRNPIITDEYTSKHNGVTHLYMRQTHGGIEVLGGIINANFLPDGAILNVGSRFVPQLAEKVNSSTPNITAIDAVNFAVRDLNLDVTEAFYVKEQITDHEYQISENGIASSPIKAKLMYLPIPENGVRLIWQIGVYTADYQHNWKMSVDAQTGDILKKRDAVLHCDFGTPSHSKSCTLDHKHPENISTFAKHEKQNLVNTYNVFPIPIESPIHGDRQLLTDPANPVASPFGWHDTDGVAGAEYTITQGNNVYATEDANDNGGIGYSPDGGANLDFDFPLDFDLSTTDNLDAAITNLFYMNNMMHDVFYQYGFDEVSGNFQQNNYGNGGSGGDFVIAEAQDGSGTNNANFSTPEDGNSGRMQMYLWRSIADNSGFSVDAPATVAGSYPFGGAGFGPETFSVTGNVVIADDGTGTTTDVCENIVNTAEISGNIALIDRGDCEFGSKCLKAENAGAVAVIICNNVTGDPITMGAGAEGALVTIPAVFLTIDDCAALRVEVPNLSVTMSVETQDLDSSFDNGIIAHEYGHGISIRLTGGPNNSGCLSNDYQMGEGWSDFMTLVMSVEDGDTPSDPRGIGNYASNGDVLDTGIRTYPYSTDMSINPHTYQDAVNAAIPHGVGSIWCAILWDLYWEMSAEHGYDPDIFNGTGGNNMAIQLVMDGMKLQACNPNFTDGRDGILLADQANYNGDNQCLIWEVFARRGVGFDASFNPANGNAFNIAPSCLPAVAPVVNFSVSNAESCSGQVCFTDISENYPTEWLWDFGDGTTSTEQNPTHTYTQDGAYTVSLQINNAAGADAVTRNDFIVVATPKIPTVTVDTDMCDSGITSLSASTIFGDIQWLDENDIVVGEGETFVTPVTTATTTYSAQSFIPQMGKIGPASPMIGSGDYHNTDFNAEVQFTVNQPTKILSVLINAGTSGTRTIELRQGITVIDSRSINIVTGESRVTLDFEINTPGNYNLHANMTNFFRNNGGVNYPYTICDDALVITGSSAGEDFYYYFYDWEVETNCTSEKVVVDIDCIVDVEDNSLVETFNVSPNPNNGTFNLELAGESYNDIQLQVFDLLGQVVFQRNYDFQAGQLNTQIELNNTAPGTYFIRLNAEGKTNYKKVVVY